MGMLDPKTRERIEKENLEETKAFFIIFVVEVALIALVLIIAAIDGKVII